MTSWEPLKNHCSRSPRKGKGSKNAIRNYSVRFQIGRAVTTNYWKDLSQCRTTNWNWGPTCRWWMSWVAARPNWSAATRSIRSHAPPCKNHSANTRSTSANWWSWGRTWSRKMNASKNCLTFSATRSICRTTTASWEKRRTSCLWNINKKPRNARATPFKFNN